jgi:hypothetical protein
MFKPELLGSGLPQKSCVPMEHGAGRLVQTLVPTPMAGDPVRRVKAETGRPTVSYVGEFILGSVKRLCASWPVEDW